MMGKIEGRGWQKGKQLKHEAEKIQTMLQFIKGGGTRDRIANNHWIIERVREFQKNIFFCFINYAKALDCVDHNKLWKSEGLIG